MRDVGPDAGADLDLVDAPYERTLPSRHRPVEPGPIGTGVYSSRPLAPLPDAVSGALEDPSREEVLRGLEVGPLWRGDVLRGRLAQAFGDHARRCGAGRILAGDPGTLPLAASVANRLGLPLERTAEAEDAGRPRSGRRAYLVARVLHERGEGGRFSGEAHPSEPVAGAGVLFRVRSATGTEVSYDRLLYIIDL